MRGDHASTRARVIGALAVDYPERLPGGVWGPPPLSWTMSWNVNGQPSITWSDGSTGPTVPQSIRDVCTARAEQPIPCVWAIQWLVAASSPPPQAPSAPISVRVRVTWGVESARAEMVIPIAWSGAQYELVPVSSGQQYLALAAQQIQIEPVSIDAATDPALATWASTWTATTLIALPSPPAVVMP